MSTLQSVSVLMVCMGNICRSPMAEAVFRDLVEAEGLGARVHVDSAWTHSYHLGNEPHPETQAELARRGVAVGDQRSRLVTPVDLESFDFVVAMDDENLAALRTIAHQLGGEDAIDAELSLLLQHAEELPGEQVTEGPDPYYVGGYDRVYELVRAGCEGLLERVRARFELGTT